MPQRVAAGVLFTTAALQWNTIVKCHEHHLPQMMGATVQASPMDRNYHHRNIVDDLARRATGVALEEIPPPHAMESSSILIATTTGSSSTPKHDDGILVVVAVDGSMAGIDRATGKLLWKQGNHPADSSKNHPNDDADGGHPTSSGSTTSTTGRMSWGTTGGSSNARIVDRDGGVLVAPLLSTTTTAQTTATASFAAVPAMNGNVYLTGHGQTVRTSVQELVQRAPFLDPQGRFYAGHQQTTAVALDPTTGQVLQVVGYSSSSEDDQGESSPWNNNKEDDDEDKTSKKSILWMGRVDYSVTIQDARTGQISVKFGVAEITPVEDLSQRRQHHPDDVNNSDDDDPYLPAPEQLIEDRLITTPSGTLAMVDPQGQVQWVAEEQFSTPIAYGISSSGRQVFQVDIVPDVTVPKSDDLGYLSRQLQRQVELIDGDEYGQGANDEQTIVGRLEGSGQLYALPLGRQQSHKKPTSSLPHSNWHHAAAIASSVKHKQQHPHKTVIPTLAGGRTAHSLVRPSTDDPAFHQHQRKPCHPHSPNFPSCLVDHHRHQPPRLDYFARGQDGRLLSESLPPSIRGDTQTYALATTNHRSRLAQEDHLQDHLTDGDAAQHALESMVYHPEYGYVKFTTAARPMKKSWYHKLVKIMRSWLPATLILLFVLSYQFGRNKRLQETQDVNEKTSTSLTTTDTTIAADANEGVVPTGKAHEIAIVADPAASAASAAAKKRLQEATVVVSAQPPQQHVIQVSDQILGYGGQGTVVYKGMLDGREVAVKRLLKAYHASADREIRLLIESDGHPHVVRYFLKEVRGDFVYLALELCDMSLHDLIGLLRESVQSNNATSALASARTIPLSATRTVLLQIASGVQHLHSLRIAHRDLKPANILLAVDRKRKKKCGSSFETFLAGSYVAKISDMGLGKQILGQSSLGGSAMATPSIQGNNGKSAASSIGVGPGTVGWQAPEVMASRWVTSDASAKSGESSTATHDASPLDFPSTNPRTSRSVDVFSLGCIFYSTMVPGYHPFGEWYEREANIVHNRPSTEALEELSPEAYQLVNAMISRDPKLRPTAKQICEHPFFWTSAKKLSFLCDFSDRLETDVTVPTSIQCINSLAIERGAVEVVGTSWDAKLDEPLISNMQRFRTYDPSSVRDLLRLIRNKHHHFDELPEDFRAAQVTNQDALFEYFEAKFPGLIMHCWNCCRSVLTNKDPLIDKYGIPPIGVIPTKRVPVVPGTPQSVLIQEGNADIAPQEGDESEDGDGTVVKDEKSSRGATPEPELDSSEYEKVYLEPISSEAKHSAPALSSNTDPPLLVESPFQVTAEAVDDVIAWVGSTTAKELNCRGWNRSDSEWARRIDPSYRKKDQNLRRAMEDPKYRTRLCNHWDVSMGTFCPMRKRNKCVFAHGPAELRVKEGKKHRWGKLVDKNGDNKNPRHSGGEDSYGAARSIESTRKEEGKWNTGTVKQAGDKGKKTPGNKKKKAPITVESSH